MRNSLKITLAQINCKVGDLDLNSDKIVKLIKDARKNKVDVICFPELVVSGYPPEDLLLNESFLKKVESKIKFITKETKNICCIVGHPHKDGEYIYNSASVLINGKVFGRYYKNNLPNYGVFDEKRYFHTGEKFFTFDYKKNKISLSICEDIWVTQSKDLKKHLKDSGTQVLINISASPYSYDKKKLRYKKIKNFAIKNSIDIFYCNLIGGQDELVFDGSSMAVSSSGNLMDLSASFKEDSKTIQYPFKRIKKLKIEPEKERDIFDALVLGLRDYVQKNGFQKVVIGISGGIDSALVAAISTVALGKNNVYGFALPTKYNSDESYILAQHLSNNLGFKLKELNIQSIFDKNLSLLYSDIFSGLNPDVTEENLQSRIRSNLLMAVSNKFNYLLLSTGNKSEMSVGYSTIYGDMSGGLAPLKDIPKTFVYRLSKFYNRLYKNHKIPMKIITREPSAELRPDQKDSDNLPPYSEIDIILQLYVEKFMSISEIYKQTGIKKNTIKRIINLIDKNEFKRRQGPPGIKVTNVAFGKDRRFPITNGFKNY
jgi:NAD+ synthase (glutamine-hydrolysing)